MRSPFFITCLSLFIVNALSAQDLTLFKKEQFTSGKDVLPYRILYPSQYDVNKKYPVIIFLHGSGERGDDNERQLIHGAKLFLDSANRVRYPAFVIFPQCPKEQYWSNYKRGEPDKQHSDSLGLKILSTKQPAKPMTLVMGLIDSLARTPQVDTDRIYLGGLSMGAIGTFDLLWRKPHFFAAAIAICGAGDPDKVKIYAKNFPIRVFHGTSDQAVYVSNSRLMVNALKAAGAKVKYTEYPGVGHESWNNAFAEPNLLKWLFEQNR